MGLGKRLESVGEVERERGGGIFTNLPSILKERREIIGKRCISLFLDVQELLL